MRYSYDTAGRLLTLTNENNASYHFKYDPLDRLIEEQGLDGIRSVYHYDIQGNVSLKKEYATQGTAIETHFERDRQGNLTQKRIIQDAQTVTTHYSYNTIGELTQAKNPTAKVTLAYDKLGRLTQEETKVYEG